MLLTQQKWHQKKYFRRIIKSSRPRSKTPRGNYIDCLFEYQFNLWSQNTHPLHTDDPSTSQHAWSRSSSHWETMNQHTTLVTATCPRSEETCAEFTTRIYSAHTLTCAEDLHFVGWGRILMLKLCTKIYKWCLSISNIKCTYHVSAFLVFVLLYAGSMQRWACALSSSLIYPSN